MAYFALQMQTDLRAEGAVHMFEQDFTHFVDTYRQGKLINPVDSGHVIAALAVNAPHDLSGEFISWDADKLKAYRA
jgi:hypothetical protein